MQECHLTADACCWDGHEGGAPSILQETSIIDSEAAELKLRFKQDSAVSQGLADGPPDIKATL